MSDINLPPIHPGEILLEEFLQPLGLSQYRLAKDIGVSLRRINEIVQSKRAITPDTALRLSRYFSMSERFWMNLQSRYDLEMEKGDGFSYEWNTTPDRGCPGRYYSSYLSETEYNADQCQT